MYRVSQNFRARPTTLAGVLVIETKTYSDSRGTFREIFRAADMEALTDEDFSWSQDNVSRSNQHVLRGIHYQLDPPQGKLVTCLDGTIFDVAVDLRQSSKTFGQWSASTISGEDGRQMWIPPGFGHAFLVLSISASVHYKLTSEHNAASYRNVAWNDPNIGIVWPVTEEPIVSEQDRGAPGLDRAELPS